MATTATVGGAGEERALRFSMGAYLFMGVLGFGFALATASEAIMLDGVYNLVSFGAAILAGRVARLVGRPYSDRFHFGYAHLEPMVNLLRGLMILGLCSLATFSAVRALFSGGTPFNAGIAVVYGFAAASACFVVAARLRKAARDASSPLLQVDAEAWLLNGVVSSAVAVAFVTAFTLSRLGVASVVPYVDPALVILLTLALIKVPIQTVVSNLEQVLRVAPTSLVQDDVRQRVEQALAKAPTRDVRVRMLTVGRFFYAMVHVLVTPGQPVDRLADLDGLRDRVAESLSHVEQRLVIDVLFTADDKWVDSMDVRSPVPAR